jgi:hypothetical protein
MAALATQIDQHHKEIQLINNLVRGLDMGMIQVGLGHPKDPDNFPLKPPPKLDEHPAGLSLGASRFPAFDSASDYFSPRRNVDYQERGDDGLTIRPEKQQGLTNPALTNSKSIADLRSQRPATSGDPFSTSGMPGVSSQSTRPPFFRNKSSYKA